MIKIPSKRRQTKFTIKFTDLYHSEIQLKKWFKNKLAYSLIFLSKLNFCFLPLIMAKNPNSIEFFIMVNSCKETIESSTLLTGSFEKICESFSTFGSLSSIQSNRMWIEGNEGNVAMDFIVLLGQPWAPASRTINKMLQNLQASFCVALVVSLYF